MTPHHNGTRTIKQIFRLSSSAAAISCVFCCGGQPALSRDRRVGGTGGDGGEGGSWCGQCSEAVESRHVHPAQIVGICAVALAHLTTTSDLQCSIQP